MDLLGAFVRFQYPNDIGPGVYDVQPPRVPDVSGITGLLEKAGSVLKPQQLWVNPDCGLKTRGWPETRAALVSMVEAVRAMRKTAAIAK